MNGKIFKAVPSISKEEILATCQFKEIPDYGEVMSYKEFKSAVDDWDIMDSDGSGELMLYGKVVKLTNTWIRSRCIYFKQNFIVPFDILYDIFGDDMQIIWYNK